MTVRRLLVVLAVGFLLPACGDDTGGGDGTAISDSPTTQPESTEGSTATTIAAEPPEDFAALDALFGPVLEEVGLDLTRAAVYRLETGPHIALYGVPAADADAPADYLDRLLPSAVASGQIAFDGFADVVSFDLCQEPTGTTSESPPPVTVVFLTRDQWETVPDWDDAGLVDLLEAATTGTGGQVEVPEDIRSLDEYDAAAEELADRRGE